MKFEFSAGGVVYKKEGREILILVAQHSQHHGWVFPKGLIGDRQDNKHQSKQETAIREVEEETGAVGEIEKELTPVTYWYQWEGEKRKKTVYYYLMKYTEGDITKHDHEMENVIWLPIEDVEKQLTYPSDKKVWQEAKQLMAVGD